MPKISIFISGLTFLVGITIWALTRESAPLTPIERGEKLLSESGCRSCHLEDSSFRAPRLEGLVGKERSFTDGSRKIADAAYIIESIKFPKRLLVEGYQGNMPSYKDTFDQKSLEDIVLFLSQPRTHP